MWCQDSIFRSLLDAYARTMGGLSMASDIALAMEKEKVGPTEDVVQALMETLVDPLLPLGAFNVTPSEDVQISVAKQMHAVVLLYNYHHRKQNPDLKFLDFTDLCKLAGVIRQNLLPFMKLMAQNGSPAPIDAHNHLSLTEKAIKEACDISKALDASRDLPNMKEWLISKVSVLLIDSKQENCMLQFGAVTKGVWSPIEKEVEDFSIDSEISASGNEGNKRKRIDQTALVYDAVKDVAGIDGSDLELLETHVTYSSSKEKKAALFYMMQYNGSFSVKEQVPLNFLVQSLQGPLAEKVAYGLWKTTPVVEYYHLLPYVEFISSWLSRKDLSNGSNAQGTTNNSDYLDHVDKNSCGMKKFSSVANEKCDGINKKSKFSSDEKTAIDSDGILANSANLRDLPESTVKDGNATEKIEKVYNVVGSAKMEEKQSYPEISDKNSDENLTKTCASSEDTSKKPSSTESTVKDGNATEKNEKVYNIFGSAKMEDKQSYPDISDKNSDENLTKTCASSEDTSKKPSSNFRVYHHRRKNNSSTQNNDTNVKENVVDLKVEDSSKSGDTRCKDDEKADKGIVPISCEQNQNGIAPKIVAKTTNHVEVPESEALQNALALLCRKRQQVYHQLCNMEVSLALCEDKIARIQDGEVGLARECIKTILSGNNNLQQEHGKDNGDSKLEMQTRTSSETYLPGKSSCQDLEYICLKNNWRLPRYIIEPLNGKFISDVFVKGKDLKLTTRGSFESKPCKARESAAAEMIAKIQKSCG